MNTNARKICVRDLRNLPVFYEKTAEIVGRVEKAVIGDDFKLAYLVVETSRNEPRMIMARDLQLNKNSVQISDLRSMKSYAHGEELSIYDHKIGDLIYSREGQELGIVSDFVVSNQKDVWGLEISSGVLQDLLEGRELIPLEQVSWKSLKSGVVDEERSEPK
ncbi:PRC-barrel domain-containing protein [Syntrophomonas erecta]